MTVHLPQIGIPSSRRAEVLLEEYPQNIVGSFWIMNAYGMSIPFPSWWIDISLEENQSQSIIDAYECGLFGKDSDLYVGFCIIVTANSSNPEQLSFLIEFIRMGPYEGIPILEIMSHFNVPAYTEVSYPEQFLNDRYDKNNNEYSVE